MPDGGALEPRVLNAGNRGPFTLDGTRSYLIGHEQVVVIDPGPDVEDHVRALSLALKDVPQVRILLTHGHGDHSGGAAALAQRLGSPVHGPASTPFSPLIEGTPIPTDAGHLIPIATPGHTRDHLAFFWPAAGALFVGDLLLGRGKHDVARRVPWLCLRLPSLPGPGASAGPPHHLSGTRGALEETCQRTAEIPRSQGEAPPDAGLYQGRCTRCIAGRVGPDCLWPGASAPPGECGTFEYPGHAPPSRYSGDSHLNQASSGGGGSGPAINILPEGPTRVSGLLAARIVWYPHPSGAVSPGGCGAFPDPCSSLGPIGPRTLPLS